MKYKIILTNNRPIHKNIVCKLKVIESNNKEMRVT